MKLLLNPFEKFTEKKLLLFGVAITLISSYLGFILYGRFDGIFDLHFTEEIALHQPFIDNCINIFSISILLFFIGRIINRKTRFIDILIAAIVARIPIYFLILGNINNFMLKLNNLFATVDVKKSPVFQIETVDLIAILIFAAFSILMLIWFVMLLFRGFKIATNCKTTAHIFFFAFGIIGAEILSKILIYFLNY